MANIYRKPRRFHGYGEEKRGLWLREQLALHEKREKKLKAPDLLKKYKPIAECPNCKMDIYEVNIYGKAFYRYVYKNGMKYCYCSNCEQLILSENSE